MYSVPGQAPEGSPSITVTNDTEASSETTTSKSSLLPEQQRILKQLLQTSTALGRAMSDLFVLLVKLSVGSAQRQRRAPHTAATPGLPTLPARHVALQLSKVLKDALTWQGLPSKILVPKLRFVCNFYLIINDYTIKIITLN